MSRDYFNSGGGTAASAVSVAFGPIGAIDVFAAIAAIAAIAAKVKIPLVLLGLSLSAATAAAAQAEQLQSRTQNGFTATAAIVGDSDWASKWSKPGQIVPDFDLVQQINIDRSATLLIFFSNPSRDKANIRVSCEMEIRDIENEVVGRLDPRLCLADSPSAEEADVYLFPDMELTTDHATATGPLELNISVTDEVRNERITLKLDVEVDKTRK
ncbi:MAG: hypothetical protein GKR97_00965 [Rhizobiaceae bacterium]|nr:hypothetical protein [Rhizobiaceae bacterium]